MTDTTASTASAAPLNVGNVHTQANNFIQAVQSGVDPRTGQFNLAITPLGMANDLGGPSWSFTLAFSSLASHINSGFGHGWGVSYSELIRDQQWWSLRLSSGEQFVVDLANSDLNVGGRLAFQDYKLDAIRVTVLANNQFKVEHKTGEFEILKRVATPMCSMRYEARKVAACISTGSGATTSITWKRSGMKNVCWRPSTEQLYPA